MSSLLEKDGDAKIEKAIWLQSWQNSFRRDMSITINRHFWTAGRERGGLRGRDRWGAQRETVSEVAPPCKSKSSMLLTCTHQKTGPGSRLVTWCFILLFRETFHRCRLVLELFNMTLIMNMSFKHEEHGKALLYVLEAAAKKKKKSKALRGTDSDCCTSCANCSKNCKKNYLIHTNCMYSLVVNFDKEESSKWKRTKIQVTMRTNIIYNTVCFLRKTV